MTETEAAVAANCAQQAMAAAAAEIPSQDPALVRLCALLALIKGTGPRWRMCESQTRTASRPIPS